MRLVEAIIEANHRAVAGDAHAGLNQAEFAADLPLVGLTCIDPRLNALFPEVLGLAKEHFIWLRNGGNIITGPLSSTMRSLALACVIKGGKEIAVIGHTDCQVRKTSVTQLTEAFKAVGIDRAKLPENLTEFFGLFASEPQNVMKAVEYIRQSPLIGAKIPVHGLMIDITSGKLDWVVNGYQTMEMAAAQTPETMLGKIGNEIMEEFKPLGDFHFGEMKFPETKIGEVVTDIKKFTADEVRKMVTEPAIPEKPPTPIPERRRVVTGIPVPPRIHPKR